MNTSPSIAECQAALRRFTAWLENYGEQSPDHQTFFAGRSGGAAKALYYRKPWLGVMAVAPLILCEALVPAARKLFRQRLRFPIADAHYAMGFAALHRVTGDMAHYHRAVHFLEALLASRCPGYAEHGWGYPFDWVTRTGVMKANTPLITTTLYVYEAFEAVHAIDGDPRWLAVMRSIAQHALVDFPDRDLDNGASTVGYNPHDHEGGVINASAYRACLLIKAGQRFSQSDFLRAGHRNLNFVLQAQQPDGSWRYATDGIRNFVDHFHTCFVLKALAKIERLAAADLCTEAIDRGVQYYTEHLFDERGLPKPFSVAPRLTVYRQELYDYAECINLGLLLRGRSSGLDRCLERSLTDLLANWQKPSGDFRARRLAVGWDNVPMHRWAQSQAFRSLALAGTPPEHAALAVEPVSVRRSAAVPAATAETLSLIP